MQTFNNSYTCYGDFIGGGRSNKICGNTYAAYSPMGGSVIVGGVSNIINSYSYVNQSFIGGGRCNTASPYNSTVVGGRNNTSSGLYSFVGGGQCNTSSCDWSVIGGGEYNTSSARYSAIIGGAFACAPRFGQRSFASGPWLGNLNRGESQQIDLIGRNRTTNATPVNIFLNGSSELISVLSGTAMFVTVNIGGIKSDGSAGAHYIRKVAIKNVGGTTSLIGTVSTIGTDVEDNASYDVTITADNTNDALDIKVTGVVSETLRWTIHIEGIEIVYGT